MLRNQYERITKRIEGEILAIPMQEYENDKSGAKGYSFGREVIDNAYKKMRTRNTIMSIRQVKNLLIYLQVFLRSSLKSIFLR